MQRFSAPPSQTNLILHFLPHLQALEYTVAVTTSFRRPPAYSDGPVQTRCHKVWIPACMAYLLEAPDAKYVIICAGC